MELITKDTIKLGAIFIVYLLLGVLGIYSKTLIFIFPLLAAPLSIYLMSNRTNLKRDIIFNTVLVGLLFITTGNLAEVCMYLIAVALPSHMVALCYRKKMSLPEIILYVSISVIGTFYLYVIAMKYMGIDYIQSYLNLLNQYKVLQTQAIEELAKVSQNFTEEQMLLFKEIIKGQVLVLELMYPAIFLVIGVLLGMIQVGIITIVGRLKRWQLPSFRQLAQFTFSKWMGALFLLGILLSQMTIGEYDALIRLGINLFFFISSLLQLLGFIVLIVLIKRKKWPNGTKLLASFTLVLLVSMSPTVLIIVGMADTLFNFRKVKIII